jgi:pyruvate ferredoxin oxidoreductase alpha subunit
MLTGNAAAAWGARLAHVDYIPAFPITPQTEIIETLAGWIERGELDARLVMLESEHSMITAAGAAAVTGVRTLTATSSQGLLYAAEMLYTVAGWRAPFVLVNVSRGLSAPITLEADHNDAMAVRDSGFLQIHCSTCQEVVDTVLIAHRLAEDPEVRLPVMVNLDGFSLSFTREPVELPDASAMTSFLPIFEAGPEVPSRSHPSSQGVAVLGGGPYSYFRYQMHLAALRALEAYDRIAAEYAERTGRQPPAVEAYRCDDAEIVFVMLGSFATKARAAVDALRSRGERVGLVRPRVFRPFPAERLRALLQGRAGAAVIDQNLATGLGGVLHTELSAALQGLPDAPVLASFVGGLGGRDIQQEELAEMVGVVRTAAAQGSAPPPRLLYRSSELREMHRLQGLAAAEHDQEQARAERADERTGETSP